MESHSWRNISRLVVWPCIGITVTNSFITLKLEHLHIGTVVSEDMLICEAFYFSSEWGKMCLWLHGEFNFFSIKEEAAVTQTYMVE